MNRHHLLKGNLLKGVTVQEQNDMSDVSQGPGWWEASDGKWYPADLHPDYVPPGPGWWLASDLKWYPPEQRPIFADPAATPAPLSPPCGAVSVIEALNDFSTLLEHRLALEVLTTEDSIRYTFFAALWGHGIRPEQVVLEYPHPTIHYARFDTMILDERRKPVTAVEFTYDRFGTEGSTQSRRRMAVSAFADLRRLAVAHSIPERYFIYVMDRELSHYASDPYNGLHEVFALPIGHTLKLDDHYFAEHSSTFHPSLGKWPSGIVIEGVAAWALPCEHCLRVYSVKKEP